MISGCEFRWLWWLVSFLKNMIMTYSHIFYMMIYYDILWLLSIMMLVDCSWRLRMVMRVFMGSNHGTSFEEQLDFQVANEIAAADTKTHGVVMVWRLHGVAMSRSTAKLTWIMAIMAQCCWIPSETMPFWADSDARISPDAASPVWCLDPRAVRTLTKPGRTILSKSMLSSRSWCWRIKVDRVQPSTCHWTNIFSQLTIDHCTINIDHRNIVLYSVVVIIYLLLMVQHHYLISDSTTNLATTILPQWWPVIYHIFFDDSTTLLWQLKKWSLDPSTAACSLGSCFSPPRAARKFQTWYAG